MSGMWQILPPFQTFQVTLKVYAVLLDSSHAVLDCGFPCNFILRILIEGIITMNSEMTSGEGSVLSDSGSPCSRGASELTVSPLAGWTWLLYHEVPRTHDV